MKINAQCPICNQPLVSPLITLPSNPSLANYVPEPTDRTPLLLAPSHSSTTNTTTDAADLPIVIAIEFPIMSGIASESVALGFHLHKPFNFSRINTAIETYRYGLGHPTPLSLNQPVANIDFTVTTQPSIQASPAEQPFSSDNSKRWLRAYLGNQPDFEAVIENVVHLKLEQYADLSRLMQCICMIAALPLSTLTCTNPYTKGGALLHLCCY